MCPGTEVLVGFTMRTNTWQEWSYRYRCCQPTAEQIKCIDAVSEAVGSEFFLPDLAKVPAMCMMFELMQGFKLNTHDDEGLQYEMRCCTYDQYNECFFTGQNCGVVKGKNAWVFFVVVVPFVLVVKNFLLL